MLALEAPDWAGLEHAYGSAADIPDWLRQLEADPKPTADVEDEPWFSLWSALCHQGDVYSGSYAAVPHIVRIAIDSRGPIDPSFFTLPASVEIARADGRGPPIPSALEKAYWSALHELHRAAMLHASDQWDEAMAQAVGSALAAAKGQHLLAQAFSNLDEEIISRLAAGDW
ncbi:MAG: hypothetical protein AB7S41_00070 [Parvibaculaceae bacterium]